MLKIWREEKYISPRPICTIHPKLPHEVISAIRFGCFEKVKLWINKHGLIHLLFWNDSCVLLVGAVMFKHKNIVELFISKGANVNYKSQTTTEQTPLHFAVHCDKGMIELLLQNGAKKDAVGGSRKSTPLYDAVLYNKFDMIQVLLNYGADVNIPDSSGTTPLQVAVRHRGVHIVKLLLQHGADTENALLDTVKGGKIQMVKLLLSYGAEINAALSIESLTPLHVAVENRHAKLVDFLLSRGADVNACSVYGTSVLCAAVEAGCPVIVNIVLSHQPDVNDKNNQNAVSVAVAQNKKTEGYVYGEIIEHLITYNFTMSPEDANDRKVMLIAIKRGYSKTLRELLKFECNMDAFRNSILKEVIPLHPDTLSDKRKLKYILLRYGAGENTRNSVRSGPKRRSVFCNMELDLFELFLSDMNDANSMQNLLRLLVWYSEFEVLKRVLRLGVDVNAKDPSGRTALHFCVLRRNNMYGPLLPRSRSSVKTERLIVELLLNSGADVNASTRNGETSLNIAAQNNLVDIVEILLNFKADINLGDEHGTTALHHLARNGDVIMTEMLLIKGAHVDKKGKHNLTPLHIASEKGHLELVKSLLDYGASIDVISKKGTPLHLACLEGHTEVVKFLVENGFDVNITAKGKGTPMSFLATRLAVNTVFHKRAGEFLYRHFMKMRAVNMYLNEENLSYKVPELLEEMEREPFWIRSPFVLPLSVPQGYREECEMEITRMKDERIEGLNLSCYDILVGSSSRMVKLSGNGSLDEIVNSSSFEEKFPNYASWIKTKFRAGKRKRALLEKCSNYLLSVFPLLPYLCVERILGYLTMVDLRVMERVIDFSTS